jgi:hypothetical protein
MIALTTDKPQTLTQQDLSRSEENFKGKIIKFGHWQDWISSQVDPDLIRANVTSLDGDTPYSYLLYAPSLDRTRSGRLSAGLLYRYAHLEDGGWWCSGLDPLNNWNPMTWGCFKPDRPYLDPKKQKPIKYEHPKSITRGTFYLNLTQRLAQNIHDRHQIPYNPPKSQILPTTWEDEYITPDRPESNLDLTFWPTVTANPTIPIILTEGAKKAACLLSHGYPAIGLPGIHGGYSTLTTAIGQETLRQLVRELDCIATPGRTIYLAFDQDTKASTRLNVNTAIRNLAALLTERGVNVRVLTWAGHEKGIDDLVASSGPQALHSAFNQADTIETWTWKTNQNNQLTIAPTLRLNTPELDHAMIPAIPDRGLLVLASGKGTGKTNLLAQILKDEPKVISLGHRIALQRNTCDRWSLNFKNDLDKIQGRFFSPDDGYTLRIGLCIDSILSISPDDVSGGILVIDEFMQVLRHLFLGDTCAKKGNRGALIEHLTHLIAAARLVILADADACDAGINYIHQWRPSGDQLPVLILNEYISQSFDTTFLETRKIDDAYQRLTEDIGAGFKTFVAIDSRIASTKLAAKLKALFPEKIGLLINSETSGEPEQRAFITNPNLHVHRYDWIIATPSLGTGVSIEVDHFNLVYGIFKGVLTDGDAAQALNRVRSKVPRIIWAAAHGQNQTFISQSQNPRTIQRSLRRRSFVAAQILRSQLGYKLSPHDREDDLTHSEPSVDFYCDLLAMENASHNAFSTALKARLQAEGSAITEVIPQNHTEDFAQAMRDLTRTIKQAEAKTITQARNLTPTELQQLTYRENLSQEDQQAIEKHRIQAFFCKTELTPDEIIFHGKYGNPIQQLEALLYGCDISNARDKNDREQQQQWGALLTPWDLKYHEVKRFAREKLGLSEFLSAKAQWTSESLDKFAELARACRRDIKLYLNLTIKEDSNNNWILSQLLTQIGLKTKLRHQGKRGQQESVYSLDDEHLAIVSAILQRRQEYRLEQADSKPTHYLDSETPLVSIHASLYSEAGGQYENDSDDPPDSPTIFISTELTTQRFKNWVFDQNLEIRRFFYPDRSLTPIEITPT